MQQKNSEVEDGADPKKYEIGQRLQFTDQDPDELDVHFNSGDYLIVVERNACGMGIDCVKEGDDYVDMVWPTEVVLVEEIASRESIEEKKGA